VRNCGISAAELEALLDEREKTLTDVPPLEVQLS
jgi:hypothetical protein